MKYIFRLFLFCLAFFLLTMVFLFANIARIILFIWHLKEKKYILGFLWDFKGYLLTLRKSFVNLMRFGSTDIARDTYERGL